MTKDQVVLIRDALHAIPNNQGGDSAPICVICDNNRLYDETKYFIKWDDDNELMWVLMPPENLDNKNFAQLCKYQTMVTAYEHIQYIFAIYTQEALDSYMKDTMGLTDDQAALAKLLYNPTDEQMLKSIRTGEQLDHIAETTEAYEDFVYGQDNNVYPKF